MEDNQQNRGKKFVRDLGIYAVGNLGSKLITFLLVPLYTYFVAPADFGYYDLCLSVMFVLSPIVSFQRIDGSFRFLIDTSDDDAERRKAVVTFSYKTLILNCLVAGLASLLIPQSVNWPYRTECVLLLVTIAFYDVVPRIVRGLGQTKYYALTGIIASFAIGILSVVFVWWGQMGVKGIFWANILGRIIAMVAIEFKMKVLKRYFVPGLYDKEIAKSVLKYCLPILPGTICWWVVESSSKFFIEHYIGLEQNGLFAVAIKFAAILQIIAIIFFQAWQENALQQYHSKDRDSFFSSVFNNYIYLLSALVVILPIAIKLNYGWLVDQSYARSADYISLLAISSMLFALAAFFDMGYQCSKQTARALPGVFLATIICVASNFLLIKPLGVYGVILSSIISYLVLLIYRYFDTRKYFRVTISAASLVSIIVVAVNALVYQLFDNLWISAIALAVSLWYFIARIPAEVINSLRRGQRRS